MATTMMAGTASGRFIRDDKQKQTTATANTGILHCVQDEDDEDIEGATAAATGPTTVFLRVRLSGGWFLRSGGYSGEDADDGQQDDPQAMAAGDNGFMRDGRQPQRQRQQQPQIPSLRCGMTNKRQAKIQGLGSV
jgi:hypothetical protein